MRATLNQPGVRSFMLRTAGPVLAAMQANAPVETGELRDSLYIWDVTTDRPVARVGSDLEYAPLIAIVTGFMSRALG
jgi:hypothetical protein